ncbi:hypothetical protein LO80_04585 [Candidatus Francisella endociliophora]|uniref:Uncharacterized protein n=1 Tax=Candidatus Francisella endociliophora TaxID=653937 RepID=A0A097EP24_9GAMM|nr:hypothetical protein [Francisella sp. FSC1006]AIT09314.1 hypothetical protein LO80_04585 [Francisella sp. FSC1006]
MKLSSKIKGSSLSSMLIIGFAVLATASTVTYIAKKNVTSINSLLSKDETDRINQAIIKKNHETELPDIDYNHLGEKMFGDYKSVNTVTSIDPLFATNNINSLLYDTEPLYVSSTISHKLYYGDILKDSKNLVLNQLPKNSMINYNGDNIPINIPYISTKRMSQSQKDYHLSENSILDSERGFVGYIQKSSDSFIINIGNTVDTISTSSLNLSSDYKIKTGWNLEDGHWTILITLYDSTNIKVLKTTINNLVNNPTQAKYDLGVAINNSQSFNQILDIDWYYPTYSNTPELLVLDETKKKTLDIYSSKYIANTNLFSTSLVNSTAINIGAQDNVYSSVLDQNSNFDKSSIFIFVGNNFIPLNYTDNNILTLGAEIPLIIPIENKPIIVKKDEYSSYVIIYDSSNSYKYLYTFGTNALNTPQEQTYNGETIENIVIKYGLEFVTTTTNVYIKDLDGNILNQISTGV